MNIKNTKSVDRSLRVKDNRLKDDLVSVRKFTELLNEFLIY